MPKTLITNARVVNDGIISSLDVLIDGERIAKIAPDISAEGIDEVIDAKGRYLMPGMIDDQVHFREPGMMHKAEIATESKAALAGGITSYMEMPNTNPLTINQGAIEDKRARAQQKSWVNYAFYLGASNDNLEDIKSIDATLICGVKVFMGASTGNMLVDDPKVLEGIFANSPTLIATHCEDTPMITALEGEYRQKYGDDVPFKYHGDIRSEAACWKSSSFAVDLAKKHGSQLHVLHLTTAKEMVLFTPGPIANKQITAEACVHHLHFSDEDYDTLGALIKCNPAVKTANDRAALLAALAEDRIDIVATDHAPHTLEEKGNHYFKAPSGLPLVQFALVALMEHYHSGLLSLPKVVEKTSHNPAIRYKVKERGFIREGYYADLVLVDIEQPTIVDQQVIHSKCNWTPFQGSAFKSSIVSTWVNGVMAYNQGEVVQKPPIKALAFDRS